eukprot:3729841-Pyramimonas_sp.AAC.1
MGELPGGALAIASVSPWVHTTLATFDGPPHWASNGLASSSCILPARGDWFLLPPRGVLAAPPPRGGSR